MKKVFLIKMLIGDGRICNSYYAPQFTDKFHVNALYAKEYVEELEAIKDVEKLILAKPENWGFYYEVVPVYKLEEPEEQA